MPTSTEDDREFGESVGISRRQAVKRFIAVAAGAVVAPGLLAACGGGSSSAGETTEAATSDGGAGDATAAASTEAVTEAASGEGSSVTKVADLAPFDTSVPPGPATGLPKVVATNLPEGSGYFIEEAKNVERAIKDRGFEYSPTTYGSDVAQNVDQITQLLQKGVGAIVVQPQDEHGEAATMLKAIEQGVCVVYSVAAPSVIQLYADQYKIGYTQGTQAVEWIKQNLGGKAQAVVFDASQIAQALIPRTTGRIDGLATGGPDIEVVAKQPMTKLTVEEGSNLAGTILQRYPDANVWLGDDDTILGVMATLQAQGKTPDDKIYLSGVNGQANALEAVKAGTLFRTDIAFPNAIYQYAMGALCCDWIEGKSVPQVLNIQSVAITPENIDTFISDNDDPAAAYERGIAEYVEYLGNIDYQNRMENYLTVAVS